MSKELDGLRTDLARLDARVREVQARWRALYPIIFPDTIDWDVVKLALVQRKVAGSLSWEGALITAWCVLNDQPITDMRALPPER
jgi:hypothetical protein